MVGSVATRARGWAMSSAEKVKRPGRLRPTELQCQDTIVQTAMANGWLVHGARAARTADGWRTPVQGHPGFPDLVLVLPDLSGIAFVELKRKPNQVEPDQQRWIDAFTAVASRAPGVVGVSVWWVPEQMDDINRYLIEKGRLR